MKVLKVITRDIRFPTSKENLGTDAVHVDCDYSAAYVTIETDDKNLSGIGLTFTIGKGNDRLQTDVGESVTYLNNKSHVQNHVAPGKDILLDYQMLRTSQSFESEQTGFVAHKNMNQSMCDTSVDLLNIDTFNKKNNFFSARRSLKLNHDDYGRNISIIMIK